MARNMSTREDEVIHLPEAEEILRGLREPYDTPGERLFMTRRRAGVGIREVAAAIGVSASKLNRWEKGSWDLRKNRPDTVELTALRDFYGLSNDWVLWVMGLRDMPPYMRGLPASLSDTIQMALA